MKRVTIPDYMKPTWQAKIGNIIYSYPAGVEMDVPDEVADLILNNDRSTASPSPKSENIVIPKNGDPGQILTRTTDGCSWQSLPEASTDTAGVIKLGNSLETDEGVLNLKVRSGLKISKQGVSVDKAKIDSMGVVYMGEAIEPATSDTIVTQFNALLDSLIDAGVIEDPARANDLPTEE